MKDNRDKDRSVFLALLAALERLDFPRSAETIFTDANTTGFLGGNHSHGGNATVVFETNGGGGPGLVIAVKQRDGEVIEMDDLESASITAWGDWEQTDLIRGLIRAAVRIAFGTYKMG